MSIVRHRSLSRFARKISKALEALSGGGVQCHVGIFYLANSIEPKVHNRMLTAARKSWFLDSKMEQKPTSESKIRPRQADRRYALQEYASI
jgi:hypothetical protein